MQRLPHVVVVIDELADLMMVVGKKIEELMRARHKRRGRPAFTLFCHAAPQRGCDYRADQGQHPYPHRLFGGLPKSTAAPFWTRWGRNPVGQGDDMLYMAGGTSPPVRVHGAFVSRRRGAPVSSST